MNGVVPATKGSGPVVSVSFSSCQERLKNIYTEHYERDQSYEEWDTSKVIRGLLLQPEVKEAWEKQLHHTILRVVQTSFCEGLETDKIQPLLKLGPSATQSSESLAVAAYVADKFEWVLERPGMEAPAMATLDETMQWDRRPLSDAHPVPRVQTPELDLMRRPVSRLMPMSPSMPLNDHRHSEHSTWTNDFMLDGSYLPGGPMPDQARPARPAFKRCTGRFRRLGISFQL